MAQPSDRAATTAMIIAAVLSLTACYKPSFKDCAIGCESATGCPSGLSCDMGSHLCSSAGTCTGGGDANRDSTSDGLTDADPCTWPFTPSNFGPCDATFPVQNGPLTLTSTDMQTIDTASCAAYMFMGVPVCLKHYSSIAISGSVTIIGRLPVILVSDSDITISGVITANRTIDMPLAAGCTQIAAPQGGAQTAGGAGAGHDLQGGNGGAGNTTSIVSGAPMYGGAALVPLELGCPGGTGGQSSGNAAGTGGNGGGAVQLAAKGTITIAGMIAANGDGGGGGGFGGGLYYGGGGGGTGGSILLEAKTVTVMATGQLCAVGGGGGQGGTLNNPGASGLMASGCQVPTGGGTPGQPGSGGAGGTDSRPGDGMMWAASRGGGGGGGAGGRIRLHGAMNVSIAPQAQIAPTPAQL